MSTELQTAPADPKTESLLRSFAKQLNQASNDMQGTPLWNNFKRVLRRFLKETQPDTTDRRRAISVNDLNTASGLKKEIGLQILAEMNSELFPDFGKPVNS